MKYAAQIDLPLDMQLGSVGEVIEKIREYGGARVAEADEHGVPNRLLVTFEADDGWDLYERIKELEDELESYFQAGIKFPKPQPREEE